MATKKKTTTKRRRRKSTGVTHARTKRSLSAAKKGVKRRKKRSRKSHGLSELANPAMYMHAGKVMVGGAAGGAIAYQANELVPATWGTGARLLVGGALSFAASGLMGWNSLGAGIAAGSVIVALQRNNVKGLHDGLDEELAEAEMMEAEFADPDVLADMPEALSEMGEPIKLSPGEQKWDIGHIPGTGYSGITFAEEMNEPMM